MIKTLDDQICCDDKSGLERVRYFPRQLLTADDMRAEQEYLRQRQRRFNRFVIGWGVACGLEVVFDPKRPNEVRVCPGYAIGPWGDEIYVPEAVTVEFGGRFTDPEDPCEPSPRAMGRPWRGASPLSSAGLTIYVAIRYAECLVRPVRTTAPGCGCDETACEYSRVRDSFEIDFLRALPTSHVRTKPTAPSLCQTLKERQLIACPPCPQEPWVVLATLRPGRSRVPIDRPDPGRLIGGGLVLDRPRPEIGAAEGPLIEASAPELIVDCFTDRRQLANLSLVQQQGVDCCCKEAVVDPGPRPGPRDPVTVDFETPSLGGELKRIINPYVSNGVTFTAESAGFGDEVVGLVINNVAATSSCVPPESATQFLAAGRSGTPEFLGATWLKLRATLPGTGLQAPVTVSVEMQTGGSSTGRVQLFDASDTLLATGTQQATPMGKCPTAQGGDRGRATVTATVATGKVAYAIIDEVSQGFIFIVDKFTFQ